MYRILKLTKEDGLRKTGIERETGGFSARKVGTRSHQVSMCVQMAKDGELEKGEKKKRQREGKMGLDTFTPPFWGLGTKDQMETHRETKHFQSNEYQGKGLLSKLHNILPP